MKRQAVIFGVTGQDGSYLSELLLDKGYDVVGVVRRSSAPNTQRVDHLEGRPGFRLVPGDVTDAASVFRLLDWHQPDEVYNLAAQSHVKVSFDEPTHTTGVVYGGCLNILEWLRHWHEQHGPSFNFHPRTRFYQASSSEMFGSACSARRPVTFYDHQQVVGRRVDFWRHPPEGAAFPDGCFQDEDTPMRPNSPYAIAKLAAHNAVRVYRESYGIFACSGILFNHESPRRPEGFVTRKVTRAVAHARTMYCLNGPKPTLRLGNLDARRDWGHARDYVRAMWLMLQQPGPDDYVVATGETHSVKEFLDRAIEVGDVKEHLKVEIDQSLFRPCEVPFLRGDAAKARRVLGWEPEVSFDHLVAEMVRSDLSESAEEYGL